MRPHPCAHSEPGRLHGGQRGVVETLTPAGSVRCGDVALCVHQWGVCVRWIAWKGARAAESARLEIPPLPPEQHTVAPERSYRS
jgi:hypothetical protein